MRARPLVMGLGALVFLVCMGVASVFLAGRLARPSLAASAYGTPVVVTTIPNVGNGPWDIAVDPTTNYVYVSNNGGGVTVINGATNAVETVIPLDGGDQLGIAVNPETRRVYVGRNPGHNDVVVIDSATTAIVATPTVGHGPFGLAVNPTTNLVYVAVSEVGVAVIDGATNQVTATPAVGSYPVAAAVNPTTNLIYVANQYSHNVSVIDGTTNTVVGTPISLDELSPHDVDVNPYTNRIYTANYGTGRVSVIDGSTGEVTRIWSVCGGPNGIAVNSITNRIYVCCYNADVVQAIDGATNALLGSPIPVPAHPNKLAVNPNTNRIYVANAPDNSVSVIQDYPIPGVGGIAELPSLEPDAAAGEGGSSAPGPVALAGIAAGGALLLVTGALYVRRHWLR